MRVLALNAKHKGLGLATRCTQGALPLPVMCRSVALRAAHVVHEGLSMSGLSMAVLVWRLNRVCPTFVEHLRYLGTQYALFITEYPQQRAPW